jgi:hypothetical protein
MHTLTGKADEMARVGSRDYMIQQFCYSACYTVSLAQFTIYVK